MSAKVPRSALDATRFTSTIPHATSKPFPSPSTTPKVQPPNATPKAPGPKGETPQEKVKRLRAALDKSRAAKETPLERMILRGRVWADRAHRYTAAGLMGFTVLACGVTTYALIDMGLHNRRKKHEYFMEKKAAYAAGLIVSRKAIEEGTANQAQIDLVAYDDAETERQARLQEEKQAKKGRWWRNTKTMLFGGLKKEEDHDAIAKLAGADGLVGDAGQDGNELQAVEETGHNFKNQARQAFADEKERERTGGPLDQLGTQPEESEFTKDEAAAAKKSWTSYLSGR